uniref:C-type lectin domain-containing protein n=1 Tax=Leptobrachium leishanense TaxID=445787 RepID=A0A8C5N5E3_9ANUR
MDSDSTILHERFSSDLKSPGYGLSVFRQKSTCAVYGLLGLAYILILVLFVVFLSRLANNTKRISGIEVSLPEPERDCGTGWLEFNKSCYFFTTSKSNWMKARTLCVRKGGDLAIITSEMEQRFVFAHSDTERHWIGLNDMEDEGKWGWIDGTDYNTSVKFWKKGEPNDYGKNEDCAMIHTTGEWNDSPCTYSDSYAICEKKLIST